MLFDFFVAKKVPEQIPSAIPTLAIYFKASAVEDIKRIKGISKNRDLAKALWISEALLSHVQARRKPVSADLYCRVAWFLGSARGGCTCAPFEVVQTGWEPANHQRNNMRKFRGEMDYEKYSISRVFRHPEENR